MFPNEDREGNVDLLYYSFFALPSHCSYIIVGVVLIGYRMSCSGVQQKCFAPNTNFCSPSVWLASCVLYLPDYLSRRIAFYYDWVIWLDAEGNMWPINTLSPYIGIENNGNDHTLSSGSVRGGGGGGGGDLQLAEIILSGLSYCLHTHAWSSITMDLPLAHRISSSKLSRVLLRL